METECAGGMIMDLMEFLLARIAEDEAVDAQMRRWGPPRVLAECSAKRRVVALHARTAAGDCAVCGYDIGYGPDGHGGEYLSGNRTPAPWPCATLYALASVYATHPDHTVALIEASPWQYECYICGLPMRGKVTYSQDGEVIVTKVSPEPACGGHEEDEHGR